MIKIDRQRCKGCGFCVKFCPRGLIHLDGDFNDKGFHPAVYDETGRCNSCGICALVCPDVAITVLEKTEEEKND